MILLKQYLLLIILLAASLYTTAEPVVVYGYELDYRLKPDGSGHYNKLLQQMQDQGLQIDLKVLPMIRATREFENRGRGCMFPASINAIIANRPEAAELGLIASDPIDRVSLRVLTHANQPVITDLQQLQGKHVGLWSGLSAALLPDIDLTLEHTSSEKVRVRMLHAGRLDAIVGFIPDVLLVAEALDLPLPHYHPELALLLDEGAAIVCYDSEDNRKMLARFNTALASLRDQGTLRNILGPHTDIIEE